jgi:hypothetical protein
VARKAQLLLFTDISRAAIKEALKDSTKLVLLRNEPYGRNELAGYSMLPRAAQADKL